MRVGIVGLGRIGGGLAAQALAKGHEVVGYDPRHPEIGEVAGSLAELCERLESPRVIFLYVPAGEEVDRTLAGLKLAAGDIVVDGGNSYWRESLARATKLAEQGVFFVDLGTSGGVRGALSGACFMAGGDAGAVARIEPFLRDLAVLGGFVYCGPSGSGHFVKLVHNGIEFGMLQAIGEGMHLMSAYPDALPYDEILGAWQNGSVVRSWLIDLMREQLAAHPFEEVPGYVEDTGEVNWLVEDALRMEVPTPVITQSVVQLLASRDSERTWAKAVALMRKGFGEHPLGPEPGVARIRKTSRKF